MTDFDELESTYEQMVDRIDSLGLLVYPRLVRIGQEAPRVVWGMNIDWQGFIDLAPKVGASVVYLCPLTLVESDLLAADDSEEPDPADPLIAHIGKIYELIAIYVAQGVQHRLSMETTWWADANDVPDETTGPDSDAELQRLLEQALREDWVRKIVNDPRYYGARSAPARSWAMQEILVEFGVESDESSSWNPTSRLAYALDEDAESMLDDVRAQIEDRALSEIPEMVALLAADNPEWWTWRVTMREQKAKRFVADRYGWAMPAVAAEVARRQL